MTDPEDPEWSARGFRRRCDLEPGQKLLGAELEIERLEKRLAMYEGRLWKLILNDYTMTIVAGRGKLRVQPMTEEEILAKLMELTAPFVGQNNTPELRLKVKKMVREALREMQIVDPDALLAACKPKDFPPHS